MHVLLAAMLAVGLAGLGVRSLAAPAVAQQTKASDQDDDYGGLPQGIGREEVFNLCQACHSLAIVKQQGLDRASWDETLVWMVEEQEMEPLDQEERKLILDYLTTHYGR
jgi:hypothetical protein